MNQFVQVHFADKEEQEACDDCETTRVFQKSVALRRVNLFYDLTCMTMWQLGLVYFFYFGFGVYLYFEFAKM